MMKEKRIVIFQEGRGPHGEAIPWRVKITFPDGLVVRVRLGVDYFSSPPYQYTFSSLRDSDKLCIQHAINDNFDGVADCPVNQKEFYCWTNKCKIPIDRVASRNWMRK